MSLDLNTVIGVVSALVAVLSLIFAWRAVKVGERNNFAGVYTELHKLYMEPDTFNSIKMVWSVYDKYDDSANGKEITHQEAYEIVKTMDRNSTEWQSIHNMSLFWKYISILMQNGYLNDEIAFNAFTSARMLGFLAPVEKAFLEYHYSNSNENNLPLFWLYQQWKKYASKK